MRYVVSADDLATAPKNEPQRVKPYLLPRAPNEDSNQPAHPHSLISLHCPHEETLHPWLFKMRTMKILIRLRVCASSSESSLDTHAQWYLFWRCGSNNVTCSKSKHNRPCPLSLNCSWFVNSFCEESTQMVRTRMLFRVYAVGTCHRIGLFMTRTWISAVPCENLYSGICGLQRPRSACASAQFDQGLHCPLQNHWILQNVWMESKGSDGTLCMRRMIWIWAFCACSDTSDQPKWHVTLAFTLSIHKDTPTVQWQTAVN